MVNGRMDKKLVLAVSLEFTSNPLHSPHLSLPTSIPGTEHQKERHHQGSGNDLMMPLVCQEALGTQSIRTQERPGGLWKYYSPEAA